jgi:hypothetical protein
VNPSTVGWVCCLSQRAKGGLGRAIKAEIVEAPQLNPAANHREVWIRDPDGYLVVLASPAGKSRG